ncbi:MAG: dUTP diphosphatase [Proteobacteria bacterium]|nr:dUTP diphosphatase [Pseudomonadota bacterium]
MNAQATLQVRVLRKGCARLPHYASEGAAGLDLSAALDTPCVIEPGQRATVPTGLAIALPEGHEGQVRPRSGLASRHGVTVLNAPGTIDEDYRGEVCVLLVNLGSVPYAIHPGDRIAQLVVSQVQRVAVRALEDELAPTSRGTRGLGSTGR